MKKIKLVSLLIIVTMVAVIGGCKQEQMIGLIENNSTPPGIVTNVNVVNNNGKATISYTLPSDQDLLYIKAVYTNGAGVQTEVKSSYYQNNLVVDGFADTLKHTVQLYSVNRSEVASAPVSVTVKPLISPIQIAFKNLRVAPVAGGIVVETTDQFRADIVIVPLVDSTGNGKWVPLDGIYTSDSIVIASIRGLPPKPRKYGFYIRDRWLNHTDTLVATLTPAFEYLMDRTKFFEFPLTDPAATLIPGSAVSLMWDGRTDPNTWPCTFTQGGSAVPTDIAFGLSTAPVNLSRFNILPREYAGTFFIGGCLKDFEVWGSNDPTADASYTNWTKLVTCHVVKPSGQPLGTETSADQQAGLAGFSFDFPPGTGAYRYLRIKCLSDWTGAPTMSIEQIYVWGY